MSELPSRRVRRIDENHHEELLAVRIEQLPLFNNDGTPSLDGTVIFHTEWWYFGFGELRGKRQGDRIEHTFRELLDRSWSVQTPNGPIDVSTRLILGGTKEAFNVLSDEHLAAQDTTDVLPPTGVL